MTYKVSSGTLNLYTLLITRLRLHAPEARVSFRVNYFESSVRVLYFVTSVVDCLGSDVLYVATFTIVTFASQQYVPLDMSYHAPSKNGLIVLGGVCVRLQNGWRHRYLWLRSLP